MDIDEKTGILASFDGVVWLRHDFMVADNNANSKTILLLGKIDDNDVTWVNSIKIGETKGAVVERVYTISKGVLKKGKNTIAIKVIDVIREGGAYREKRGPIHRNSK